MLSTVCFHRVRWIAARTGVFASGKEQNDWFPRRSQGFHVRLPGAVEPGAGERRRGQQQSLTRHGQADLAAESRKARIVLIALDEGVVEEVHDAWIAGAPSPIEPLECCIRI